MLKLKRAEDILLFLTLLFLPTQLGKHFWPEFSFIYSLPIDYLSPVVYFWDLLVLGLITSFVLQKGKFNRLALNLFLLFLLSQTLSLMQNIHDAKALGVGLVRLEQYLVAGFFGVYIASLKLKTRVFKLFLPLSLAVLGESLLSIAQFLKAGTVGFWILGERTFTISTPAIAKFDFYGRQLLRPYATLPHPNVLAGFLVVSIVILSLFQGLFNRFLNKFKVIIFFLAGFSILLTVSRSAIIAGSLAALWLLNKKWKMAFLALLLFLMPILFVRFYGVFNFDSLSITRREQLFEVAIEMFKKSPIFGMGLNNFIPTAADQLLVGPSRFLQPVHNIFLLTLSETGVIGVTGLMWLIGYPIFKLFKLRTMNYELRTLLLVWGVIIFLGMFDHYFLTLSQGYRLLFLVWGISLSMLEWRR